MLPAPVFRVLLVASGRGLPPRVVTVYVVSASARPSRSPRSGSTCPGG